MSKRIVSTSLFSFDPRCALCELNYESLVEFDDGTADLVSGCISALLIPETCEMYPRVLLTFWVQDYTFRVFLTSVSETLYRVSLYGNDGVVDEHYSRDATELLRLATDLYC